MTTTTKTKKGVNAISLANLRPGRGRPRLPETRTVHASARLTEQTKERLTEILNQKKLSLADFLEKIANEQYIIVEK
ncbi:MAG: hypothetical protein ACKPEN_16595 [Planktothrix sp.]|uniref:hypothetical protein n=1 Tax=Planktothrix sp. TaxID=3088171 RepID=UPI0038D3ACEA